MSISFEIGLAAVLILGYLDVIIICKLLVRRIKKSIQQEKNVIQKKELVEILAKKRMSKITRKFPDNFLKNLQSILPDLQLREDVERHLNIHKLENKYIKMLRSVFQTKRMIASMQLCQIASERARIALEKAILKEKSYPVKLYIAYTLSEIRNEKSIPVLVNSLLKAHRWYRRRVNMMIVEFGNAFDAYLPQIANRNEEAIIELIVDFSEVYFSPYLKKYLIELINEYQMKDSLGKHNAKEHEKKSCANCYYGRKSFLKNHLLCKYYGPVRSDYKCRRYYRLFESIGRETSSRNLVYKAAEVLAKIYPKVLNDEKYLKHEDVRIQNIAVGAVIQLTTSKNIYSLRTYLDNEQTSKTTVHSISKMIDQDPELIQNIEKMFQSETNTRVRVSLAEILSRRIEYFIMKISSRDKEEKYAASEIIQQILLTGKLSDFINFLNKNKDIDIENELVIIIKKVYPKNEAIEKEFCMYLNDRLLNKCGFTRCDALLSEKKEKKDKSLIQI